MKVSERWLVHRPGVAALALVLVLVDVPAHAAGFRLFDVPAGGDGPALHGGMWSPCTEAPAEPGRAVKDCPVAGDRLPLVVISHGRVGSINGHQDTAVTLVEAGYVVAAINHPGDTGTDMSRTNDLSVFIERPTDIKRLIDFMLSASPAAAKIDPERIGFFGFSRGGYTGLVLIGAEVDWAALAPRCIGSPRPICQQILAKQYPPQLTHDPRIKAAVIADPLAIFFAPDSYAAIRIPVQLWGSETGGDGVEPQDVAKVDANLASPHEYRVVPNSRHFAFLTPCPPEAAARKAEPCVDPPGFDRAAFHKEFDASVLAFFRANLGKP